MITQFGAPDAPFCNPDTVGTPEPGGLHWYQLLDLFRELCHRTTIVGMDVVELCLMEGQTCADFLAAKLVYKMIGYRFCDKK